MHPVNDMRVGFVIKGTLKKTSNSNWNSFAYFFISFSSKKYISYIAINLHIMT